MLFNKFLKNNYIKLRFLKILYVLFNPYFLSLAKNGIFPAIEHLNAINKINKTQSLIDCGSNKGQFFTLFQYKKKITHLLCFDPLVFPQKSIKKLDKKNIKVIFENKALSSSKNLLPFYVTNRKDSSSLKKIKSDALNYFSDIKFEKEIYVQVKTLDDYAALIKKLPKPISLKVDVQGSEYDLLVGSSKIIKLIKYIFIEINDISIYEIDSNSNQIIDFLNKNGFKICLKYNKLKSNKKIISYDYLFINQSI